MPQSNQLTQLLRDWGRGDKAALDRLTPLIYNELRKLAGSHLKRERPDHTLQPTALIHEAYVRLVDQQMPQWESRAHFFGVASRLMRQILVDYARRRGATRRGGDQVKSSFNEADAFSDEQAEELLALDTALDKLAAIDERKCRVIEMRSFAGMTLEETASALKVSVPTVKNDLRMAKAWLRRELEMAP